MEIKGIFFDLYGTLLKYGDMQAEWFAVFDALYRTLSGYNCPVDRNTLWESCRGLFSGAEPPGIGDRLTVYERLLERLFERLHLHCNADIIKRVATETLIARMLAASSSMTIVSVDSLEYCDDASSII